MLSSTKIDQTNHFFSTMTCTYFKNDFSNTMQLVDTELGLSRRIKGSPTSPERTRTGFVKNCAAGILLSVTGTLLMPKRQRSEMGWVGKTCHSSGMSHCSQKKKVNPQKV